MALAASTREQGYWNILLWQQ